MAGEPEGQDEDVGSSRRSCTLSAPAIKRLEKLAKNGAYGTTLPRVMTSLIEQGLRQAMQEGFIKKDDPEE